MIPTTEKTPGITLYPRRVVIMDDRASTSTVEVTFWEDNCRAVDRNAELHQIVAVTATNASKFQRTNSMHVIHSMFFASKLKHSTKILLLSGDVQLTSTKATMCFVDPPIPDLQQLKESTDLSNLV
ncbi:hypothetical protein CASFOL_031459 [Castilleja foliolosa]|uniref:Uncharacterized protein n=1 Tax=Castilleja foliolosa TaxID=1961234 RepID=A0ABD3C6P0_9LAMI